MHCLLKIAVSSNPYKDFAFCILYCIIFFFIITGMFASLNNLIVASHFKKMFYKTSFSFLIITLNVISIFFIQNVPLNNFKR